MGNLMKMGGTIDKKTSAIISIIGLSFITLVWYLYTRYGNVPSTILPKPMSVISSFGELSSRYNVIHELLYSIKLCFLGYIEAIAISIPLGFFIGLFPLPKALFSSWVDSVRFLPLTAVTGLFIAWFGIELNMKVHFLSFGIIIYLLPIIVKRINDVEKIHLQTAWTIGCTNWQTFRYVYLPSVMSKLFSDIGVIVAVSWSYIVVAELINSEGGVGSLIFKSVKQGRMDMVFALLILIILVGFMNDLIFRFLDWLFFPYNYESSQFKSQSGFKGLGIKVKNSFTGFAKKYLVKPEEVKQ